MFPIYCSTAGLKESARTCLLSIDFYAVMNGRDCAICHRTTWPGIQTSRMYQVAEEMPGLDAEPALQAGSDIAEAAVDDIASEQVQVFAEIIQQSIEDAVT